MPRLALYPGTFDPFTLGHLDIAQRALRLFDAVEIIVAVNPEKTVSMPAAERAALIRAATAGIQNLSVHVLEGLIAKYAGTRGAVALIRGFRAQCDFAYEAAMAAVNRRLCPGLETVFFPTAPDHAHTSASLVRDIARWGGDLTPFVPSAVVTVLSKQHKT